MIRPLIRLARRAVSFIITVILWFYFLFGYLILLPVFFLPFYLWMKNASASLQRLNHFHLRAFFGLGRLLIPGTRYEIAPEVRALRSSIIVCNHISYLDPILLVSLYPRQTTIVKSSFFRVPIFGWFLKKAGYVPSSASEMFGLAMLRNLEDIKAHLAAGGNLFVFPEGTRSRDGRVAPFNKGVFSIARYCNAGLKLVWIGGTDKLFRPGTFVFNTFEKNTIVLTLAAFLEPAYSAGDYSTGVLADRARKVFETKSGFAPSANDDVLTGQPDQ
ncbi:MAG: lysophospholipid acyltransferase family protein [Smithellaceae bacterium]